MPKGDKTKYTDKQKRQAEHIKESYKARGSSKPEAQKRARATVNKASGGGKKASQKGGAGTAEQERRSNRHSHGGAATRARAAAAGKAAPARRIRTRHGAKNQ